jgi:signal transduction histidine kinase
MRWFRSPRIPLARKISLLFGTAVLLVIAVTLAFPLFQMTGLHRQAMLLRAKRMATVAALSVDLQVPDWTEAELELSRRWPVLARELGLTGDVPRLVPADRTNTGFQKDAVQQLRSNPDQRYFWRIQHDGDVFGFAMAVRGTAVDPHPEALRGIIDVRLPVQADLGVWNWVVTVLAGASGAVLAILVFYVVTQRLVLTPVRWLRRVAERVGGGDLDVRADIRSGDEFAKLAKAFNDMLVNLKEAREEQERINRSLDIRLGELAEVNVALYESSRLKSEFLTNVTHELRTPLVSIIGFAELLRDATDGADIDKKRLARFAQNILTSGRSLLDLINDLLDLTKIEAGRLDLHLSEFSIEELCGDLIDFVRPLADKREQKLTLRVEPELPRLSSDSGRVKQILYNLLSNAIKFTPTGGSIDLIAARDGADRVGLSVRDTGPGIPEEHRARIFDQFHQIDPSQTREHAGTGLGLTITKELVQLLGGTIALQTELGQGSTFTVHLPITTPTPRHDPPRPKIKLT